MKKLLLLTLLYCLSISRFQAQESIQKADLFHCQYRLNNESYKTAETCSIKICDEDELEIRLTSISQRPYDSKFNIWKSPSGRIDYGKIRLLRNPDRYGTYGVVFNVDGETLVKKFIVEKEEENCKKDSCGIQGFWWGTDRKYETYFDFNKYQLIVRENKSAAECPVRYIFSYNLVGDTLLLDNKKFPNLKLRVELKNCSTLYLTDLGNRGFIWNQTLILNRIAGARCDCDPEYIMQTSFFERELPQNIIKSILLGLYFCLLLSFIYQYFKGSSFKMKMVYLLISGFLCFLYSFFDWLAYYLFAMHMMICFKMLLNKIKFLNSIGKLCFFSIFAGLLSVFEFYLRFGESDLIQSWFSLLNLFTLIIGFSLFRKVIRDGLSLGYSFQFVSLIAILLLGGPQTYVAVKRLEIIEYVKDKVPDFSFDEEEVCPEV